VPASPSRTDKGFKELWHDKTAPNMNVNIPIFIWLSELQNQVTPWYWKPTHKANPANAGARRPHLTDRRQSRFSKPQKKPAKYRPPIVSYKPAPDWFILMGLRPTPQISTPL